MSDAILGVIFGALAVAVPTLIIHSRDRKDRYLFAFTTDRVKYAQEAL